MTVGLLIITHDDLGKRLLSTAAAMLGKTPLPTATINVSGSCDPDTVLETADKQRQSLDQGGGVLVLTDMYGSTPANIATRLKAFGNVQVVTGINLPMLVRVLNYPALSLDELVNKALSGGRDGVMQCN